MDRKEQRASPMPAPSASSSGFRAALEQLLPEGESFHLIHIVTHPKKVRKLIFTSSNDKTLDTVVTHYFILVHKDIAIFALELLAYESRDTCTLFVSKADTSGHYEAARISIMAITQALIKEVVLEYFVPYKTARICLFAKKEGQYLFLGSVDNPKKHILPDSALVKWWTRCIDGMQDIFEPIKPGKCTLAIPGIDDPAGIAKYFPTEAKLPWSAGDIFWGADTAAMDDDSLAVNRIPRFPDDPKSRFLDALVAEQRAKQVSRKQYWLELQSRQEFRLSKSVGIIGIEGSLKSWNRPETRTPTVTYKESQRFKELLISLNFSSKNSSIDGTRRLLEGTPESSHIFITGQGAAVSRPSPASSTVPQKRINTLGVGMIRKKQKQ